jgi:hypothetical protein
MRSLLLMAPCLLLCVSAIVAQERPAPNFENITVTGVVHGEDGEPRAGVMVSDAWNYTGQWAPRGGATTDDEGRFSITVRTFPAQPQRGYRIQAGDADSTVGALRVLTAEQLREELQLSLQPLGEVKGTLKGVDDFEPADGGTVNAFVREPRLFVGSARVQSGAFSLKFPAGDYMLSIRAGHAFRPLNMAATVAAGETQDLGELQLELTPVAANYGKPAPALTIEHVRNLPEDLADKGADVTLADFKGRWVVLEFWGFW